MASPSVSGPGLVPDDRNAAATRLSPGLKQRSRTAAGAALQLAFRISHRHHGFWNTRMKEETSKLARAPCPGVSWLLLHPNCSVAVITESAGAVSRTREPCTAMSCGFGVSVSGWSKLLNAFISGWCKIRAVPDLAITPRSVQSTSTSFDEPGLTQLTTSSPVLFDADIESPNASVLSVSTFTAIFERCALNSMKA